MAPWIVSGFFLVGPVGLLTTLALPVRQIRRLKDRLQAARSNSQTEDKDHDHEPDGRKSA